MVRDKLDIRSHEGIIQTPLHEYIGDNFSMGKYCWYYVRHASVIPNEPIHLKDQKAFFSSVLFQ